METIYKNNASRSTLTSSRRVRGVIDMKKALENKSSKGKLGLIVEFKRTSPSGFKQEEQNNPRKYFDGIDASKLAGFSVLTEPTRFLGSWDDLTQCQDYKIPLLAKDFFEAENMIHDAYLSGADAVLLIADFLAKERIGELAVVADKLGMSALIEFHDLRAAEKIPMYHNVIAGYNRRNLRTMKMEGQERDAAKLMGESGIPLVLESGLDSQNTRDMSFDGYDGLLIGSSILKGDNVVQVLEERGLL